MRNTCYKRLTKHSSSFCTCPSTFVCNRHPDMRCTTVRHAHQSCTVSTCLWAGAPETASDPSHNHPKSHNLIPTASHRTRRTWTKTGCDSSCVGTQAAQWADVLSKMREEDKQNATQWVQHHTQPCPGCGSRIQKNGGCNHMSCAVCRRQFCWVSSYSTFDTFLILTLFCAIWLSGQLPSTACIVLFPASFLHA